MSVKKGERKPSCNEAFHVAHQIKNELLNYVFTDLGIDTAKARNYPQVFINYITLAKDDMYKQARELYLRVSNAACCKVVTDIDLKYRREQIIKAIAACYKLEQVCMTFIETSRAQNIDVNINKYYRLTLLIVKEIDLLRSVKNKDLQQFRKLKKNQETQGVYFPVG